MLKNASKKGAGQGYPEFIISSETLSDFLIVIECKADPTKHVSKDGDRYAEYAVDGVLLYAAFLSKAFDVLAIAVSGETTATLRMSHYLHLRGASQPVEFVTPDIIPFNAFYEKVTHSDIKFRQDYDALLSFSRELNENLQAKKSRKLTVGFLYAEFLLPLRTPRSREALGCRRQPSILQTILSNRS